MRLARLVVLATCLAAPGFAAPGLAAAQSADDAIAARRGFFQLLNVNLALLEAMAKGDAAYDAAKAGTAAANLKTLAAYPLPDLFVAGSSQADKRGLTAARPEIWADRADFAAKFKALQEAIPSMAEAAAKGRAEIGAAMQTVGGACVACHRAYRARSL
jgi:cytochrome c556